MLRLEGVGKRYGRRRVLTGVDLQVGAGDFLLLTGANGSGKTTLLRLLATTLRPSEGRIRWDGMQERAPSEEVRRNIGFVAHHPLVYDELTALENVRFVAAAHGVAEPAAAARRWIEAFGLSERTDERVSGFSRGTKQRLALAQAFVTGPRLLLLDEPSASLDGEAARLLLDRLEDRPTGTAVVLATHDPQPFQSLASRHLQILQGRLVEAGAGP